MKLASRLQALIEINNDFTIESHLPVDRFLRGYFLKRRYIGSKDRHYLKESYYKFLRRRLQCQWWARKEGASLSSRIEILTFSILSGGHTYEEILLFCDGAAYAPQELNKFEAAFLKKLEHKNFSNPHQDSYIANNLPEWLYKKLLQNIPQEQSAQNIDFLSHYNANTDLRVNFLQATSEQVLGELRKKDISFQVIEGNNSSIRLSKSMPLGNYDFFNKGWVEVQDYGSQQVAKAIGCKAGDRVLDFCAGAGGKTLAMAMHMENKGKIIACDTSEKRLLRMKTRLNRSNVNNTQLLAIKDEHDSALKKFKKTFDHVVLDVPCSGTGTLRRNPDLKWRLEKKDIYELTLLQQSILVSAQRFVKEGGYLSYITCSLLKEECEEQITKFLYHHEDFEVVGGLDKTIFDQKEYGGYIYPSKLKTDGFYFCKLQRKHNK